MGVSFLLGSHSLLLGPFSRSLSSSNLFLEFPSCWDLSRSTTYYDLSLSLDLGSLSLPCSGSSPGWDLSLSLARISPSITLP